MIVYVRAKLDGINVSFGLFTWNYVPSNRKKAHQSTGSIDKFD